MNEHFMITDFTTTKDSSVVGVADQQHLGQRKLS